MISPSQKLNQKIFDRDVEQVPIRKGELWDGEVGVGPDCNVGLSVDEGDGIATLFNKTRAVTQSARPEADVPRRGRGIFQQKNICDLVKNNAFQIPC